MIGMVAVNIPIRLALFALNVWLIRRVAPDVGYGWRGAKRNLVAPILSFSALGFVINASWQVQTKSDEIVIGALISVAAITPYSLARKLSEAATLLSAEFVKVLLPIASQLDAQDDRDRMRWLYLASTRLTLAILLPVSSLLVLFGGQILAVWVGPRFAAYGELVTILTIAGVLSVSQWAGGSMVMGMGRHGRLAWAAAAGAAGNLALSLALVPHLGLMGVALGTLIPAAVESLLFVAPHVLKTVEIDAVSAIRKAVLPAAIPLVPMAIVLVALGRLMPNPSLLSLALTAAVGLTTYGVVYALVGASTYERALARSLVSATRAFTGSLLKRP